MSEESAWPVRDGYRWWRYLPMDERKPKLKYAQVQAHELWRLYPVRAEAVVPRQMLRLLPNPKDNPLWLGRERQWQVYQTCNALIKGVSRCEEDRNIG